MNKWLEHLMKEKKKDSNKGKSLKQVMAIAKESYSKKVK
jgi:hypothetical protein